LILKNSNWIYYSYTTKEIIKYFSYKIFISRDKAHYEDFYNLIKYSTQRYIITEKNGKLYGEEKPHEALKENKLVLVQRLEKGKGLESSILDAFKKIQANSIINKGDKVAIKVNLGGGIDYIPTTYSDPIICEAIIRVVKKLGGKPFVCEANMRARIINKKLLKIRGYWNMLKRNHCEFVNLSKYSTVLMKCFNLKVNLKFY